MPLTVYFPTLPMPNTLEELRPLVPPEVRLLAGPGDEQPLETDILVGGAVTAEQLARSPGVRAVIVPFAGVPFPTQALLRARPQIALHNLHFNTVSTAEMALTLLLAAAKHLTELDRRIRVGDWRWDDATHPTDTLPGKTAVILGYGAIGRRLAPLLRALGMEVIGVRRHRPAEGQKDGARVHGAEGQKDGARVHGAEGQEGEARVHGAETRDEVRVYAVTDLPELLPRADVLICLLPHTPETEGLLGAAELGLLPAHCVLVNVGRGPVIDEEALYAALAGRRIRAAGIDVWYQYPADEEARGHTFPARLPFHELDNVVMTPHRAGWLQSFEKLRCAALAELLNAAAAGRPLANLVDKELGY
jgi:phosphoglycerate dehydrogenase-like enzyme